MALFNEKRGPFFFKNGAFSKKASFFVFFSIFFRPVWVENAKIEKILFFRLKKKYFFDFWRGFHVGRFLTIFCHFDKKWSKSTR